MQPYALTIDTFLDHAAKWWGIARSSRRGLAALLGRIADWWIPDQVVEIVAMPLAPTGKIDKRRLRDDYSNGRIKAAEPLS